VRVTLACETAGASIYYTLDGSDPTTSAILYSDTPFTLTSSAMVNAKAFKSGYNASASASASFTVTATPKLSIQHVGSDVQLSWPCEYTGFQLESAPSLVGQPVWEAVTNAPVVVGTDNTVKLGSQGQMMFFRLLKPATPTSPDTNKFVWIAPGTFTMGSPASEQDRQSDEGPQTVVTVTRGFWMGRYEVTQGEYQAVMGSNPSYFGGDLNNPVEMVSWYDATNYCGKLTEAERAAGRLPAGYVYRLPTEAEWEYACRAATATRFSYGDDPGYSQLGNYAWYLSNSEGRTHAVGLKQPNGWGLCDMAGNVLEWCLDWYGTYPGGSVSDPVGPTTGSDRVFRGGGWTYGGGECRSALRPRNPPVNGYADLGFRAVLAPDQPLQPTNPDPTKLAWIPSGTFTMGSPASEQDRYDWEGPQTVVTITRGFWMGRYEVTQVEYLTAIGSNPSGFQGNPNLPVETVSWYDATNYCGKLTEAERAAGRLPAGYVYRLPTEAEWEYACRAGTTTRFSYGDDPGYAQLGNYAWYDSNSGNITHAVGLKQPNPWGLYDMAGNVLEWCLDWYGTYPGGSVSDPVGPATGSYRVLRGSAWDNDGRECRSASRSNNTPFYRNIYAGFRAVLAPGQP
jgi:formylglycine-generating enzyme required for sulfatase activity